MATFRNIHDYSDIINQPYQKSTKHPPMSTLDRAAQFAPFAPLTGHKEAVLETARYVSSKKILDDDQKHIINQQLRKIKAHSTIELTYFVADANKTGGAYITDIISIKKIDEYEKVIITTNNQKIKIEDIYEILEIRNL